MVAWVGRDALTLCMLEAEERVGPEVRKAEKLLLPAISCNTQEKRPCPHLGNTIETIL